jgi:hypothetical protein
MVNNRLNERVTCPYLVAHAFARSLWQPSWPPCGQNWPKMTASGAGFEDLELPAGCCNTNLSLMPYLSSSPAWLATRPLMRTGRLPILAFATIRPIFNSFRFSRMPAPTRAVRPRWDPPARGPSLTPGRSARGVSYPNLTC